MEHYRPINYAPHYTWMDSVLYTVACGLEKTINEYTSTKRNVTCKNCRKTKLFKRRN